MPPTGGKRLVLVVQGIGDSAPGATVGSLARSLAIATGRSPAPVQEVWPLAEGSGRQIEEEEFPCHVERLEGGGGESVLAEVYWADLSRLGGGPHALLVAVFRALFGLHQAFGRHAAAPFGRRGAAVEPAARVLQMLTLGSAYLLRGPAAASVVHFALLSVLTVAAVTIGGDLIAKHEAGWVAGIFLATNLIACGAGAWGFRRRRGGTFRALFLWLALFGAAGLVTWAVSLAWFPARVVQATLGKSWLFSAGLTEYPVFLAFSLIALATLPWLVARLRAAPDRRPGIDFAQALNVLVIGLWVLVVQALYLAVYANLPEAAPEARKLATGVSGMMAFYCLVALLPIGALLVTVVRYLRWGRRNRAATYQASGSAPRLALGRGIVASLIALPIFGLARFLVPELGEWLSVISGSAWRVLIPAAALIGAVALYVSDRVRTVLDFALDVVAYLEMERSPEGALGFARRRRIQQRLRIVLATLMRRERPDRVTFLAHSLGTMVTIDTLAGEGIEELLRPVGRADLVTMASPFHHVFQHYLCGEYPPLADQRWDGLRDRVGRWVNIFRIDDFVGTDIEPGGDWPENCPVDPGGHVDYWSDRQVLAILHERRLV